MCYKMCNLQGGLMKKNVLNTHVFFSTMATFDPNYNIKVKAPGFTKLLIETYENVDISQTYIAFEHAKC